MLPTDVYYTKDHEWVKVDGDVGTVGITDFAQQELGDVVFVELPAVGRTLKAHDTFGTVESVKAVSDLFAPVSGEVIEINQAVVDSPETLNEDPHGAAWLLRIRLKDPGEVGKLLDAEAYRKLIEGGAK